MLSLDRQNALREQYALARPGWVPATERYAAHVREHLPPTGRLLDIGCGRGGLVEQLSHPARRLTGIDPDQASLKEHRLGPLPKVVALSEALPFTACTYDVVTASWVLEHLRNPTQDLVEIARTLKPGGVLVFITPNKRHPLVWFNLALSRLSVLHRRLITRLYGRSEADTFPAHYRANTVADLAAVAHAAGMKLELVETVVDPTYWAAIPGAYRLLEPLESRAPRDFRLHLVGIMRRPPGPMSGRS